MLETIQFSPDGYFYHCSSIDLYTKLVSNNILPQGLIDHEVIRECNTFLTGEAYDAGPIFPLILLVANLLNLGYFLNLIHIFLFGVIYIFLLKRFLNLINFNDKKKIIFSVLISPIFIWLLIYPSTDIISSTFILISLSCIPKIFKQYNSKYPHVNKKRSFIKLNTVLFSSIFIGLLCRPTMFIVLPILIVFYLIKWSFNAKNKQNKITLIHFLYSKNLAYLIFSILIFGLISNLVYSNYTANTFPENEFQLHGFLFETYSPPAPPGLKEFTHTSFSRFYSLLNNITLQNIRFVEISKQLLFFILSIIQSLIFSLLSLAGFQISIFNSESNLVFNSDNISIFRYIFSTYKLFYALFINLPGIFMIFLNGYFSINELINKPINFLIKEENLFKIFSILSMTYFIPLLFTIGHIRYLLPIYPILVISSYDFWNRLILTFKNNS